TYLLHGTAGGQLVSQLQANKTVHKGTGRTGFPDIYVDGTKTVHLTFGSEQTVSYNQYTRLGKKRFATDKKLFSSLGNWHLSTGLSAVAASDDGQTIVVVALRSDGSQDANNSDILWALSQDGGVTFAPPQDLKHKTDAGEGRRRPRLVAIGNTFYLFYFDKGTSALSLATLAVVGGGTDGGAADIGGTDGGAVDGVVSPRDAATADHGASAEGITADDAIAVSGDAHRNDATSPQSLAGGCGCRSAGMGARPAFISLVLVFFLIWRSRRRST
ncbi:MAG: hypothetical protein KAI47_09170, partial [Deltaproteobacteria bacterium]|nr:hypothetical protein [Deltaproteobacteria bacterium]